MDVEAIAYLGAKLARVKGLLSSETYAGMVEALATVRGELDSLKSQCGRLQAEIENVIHERNLIVSERDALRREVEIKSIVEVDAAVEKLVAAEERAEVIAGIENPAIAETVPPETIAT